MTIPASDASRASDLNELRASLQALAMPPSTVPALFPELVVKADDLALNFDHWASVVRDRYEEDLSRSQVECLTAIGQKLSTMSRDGADFDADLWTPSALSSSPHWDEVPALATSALEAFGEV